MPNVARICASWGALAVALAVALVACSPRGGPPPACTALAVAAVILVLSDATTGAAITGATATLVDGAFVESMREDPPGTWSGGFERPGTYQVQITADGYEPRTLEDVRAPALACGPQTQRLEVALQPTGSAVHVTIDVIWVDDVTTWALMRIREEPIADGARPGPTR